MQVRARHASGPGAAGGRRTPERFVVPFVRRSRRRHPAGPTAAAAPGSGRAGALPRPVRARRPTGPIHSSSVPAARRAFTGRGVGPVRERGHRQPVAPPAFGASADLEERGGVSAVPGQSEHRVRRRGQVVALPQVVAGSSGQHRAVERYLELADPVGALVDQRQRGPPVSPARRDRSRATRARPHRPPRWRRRRPGPPSEPGAGAPQAAPLIHSWHTSITRRGRHGGIPDIGEHVADRRVVPPSTRVRRSGRVDDRRRLGDGTLAGRREVRPLPAQHSRGSACRSSTSTASRSPAST